MSKIIFSPFKLEIINSYAQKSEEKKYNGSPKILPCREKEIFNK